MGPVARRPARAVCIAIAAISCAFFAQAEQTANGQSVAFGTASARVIAPLSITELDDLDFGFVRGAAGSDSTVSISPFSAKPEYRGGAQNACAPGGTCPAAHPAGFSVTGEALHGYVVTLPGEISVATGNDGTRRSAGSLLITDLVIRTDSAPRSGNRGTLDSSGHDTFAVGGTLRLQPGVPPGHYRATVPLVVAYN